MTRIEKADRLCIKTFGAFLQAIGRAGAYPIEWPEDTRPDGQIDAVFGPYAIQHTSVVSLPEGHARDAWSGQVIGDLERELRGTLGTLPLHASPIVGWWARQAPRPSGRISQPTVLPSGQTKIGCWPGCLSLQPVNLQSPALARHPSQHGEAQQGSHDHSHDDSPSRS